MNNKSYVPFFLAERRILLSCSSPYTQRLIKGFNFTCSRTHFPSSTNYGFQWNLLQDKLWSSIEISKLIFHPFSAISPSILFPLILIPEKCARLAIWMWLESLWSLRLILNIEKNLIWVKWNDAKKKHIKFSCKILLKIRIDALQFNKIILKLRIDKRNEKFHGLLQWYFIFNWIVYTIK